jgi:hypothetical protein
MLSTLFKGLFRAERKLHENSVVGQSKFEREFSWAWALIFLLLILIGVGIKRWLF